MVKRGRPDYAAERDTHASTAVLNLQAGDSSAATAAALLALEAQFGRIADAQLAKEDHI
jgi:hypothetical protein